jgi:thiosulfate dehydrogenase [quinone] large subunit
MFTMTRQKTYILTALSAALYVALAIVFADDLFTGTFFDSDAIFGSTWLSYVLLALVIVGGVAQARRIPEAGVIVGSRTREQSEGQIDDPVTWKLLLGNTYLAILWMPIRFFVGQEWLSAGEHKVRDSAWMDGGAALKGYWTNAVAVSETGRGPITYNWFRDFLQFMLDHEWYTWFAKLVAVGEVLVGLGLIFGALVGIAAFFGTVLNFNFLLAGTTSTNPVLFAITVFLVLGWKVAGYIGLDRVLLPALGTPWNSGKLTSLHRSGKDDGKSTKPAQPQVI